MTILEIICIIAVLGGIAQMLGSYCEDRIDRKYDKRLGATSTNSVNSHELLASLTSERKRRRNLINCIVLTWAIAACLYLIHLHWAEGIASWRFLIHRFTN